MLAGMSWGPLAFLGGPAFWVIPSVHTWVQGPLAAVSVAHLCPRVPHVCLWPLSWTPRSRCWSRAHHAVLRWPPLTVSAILIRKLALDRMALGSHVGPTCSSSGVRAEHVWLLRPVLLHSEALALVALRGGVQSLHLPLVALQTHKDTSKWLDDTDSSPPDEETFMASLQSAGPKSIVARVGAHLLLRVQRLLGAVGHVLRIGLVPEETESHLVITLTQRHL